MEHELAAHAASCNSINVAIKEKLRNFIRPAALVAYPFAEARSLQLAQGRGRVFEITWRSAWDEALDEALASLPPVVGCPHDHYRTLMANTGIEKRHALVRDGAGVTALVSLRRRRSFWEPVTCQCLPAPEIPARDYETLGRVLAALGVEVRMASGLGEEVHALKPLRWWSYDYHQIDMRGDYEGYWRERKRMFTIRRARKTLAKMRRRLNDVSDMEWMVAHWRQQWANDKNNEIVATPDRLALWRALMERPGAEVLELHSLQLLDGEKRAAGLLFTHTREKTMLQCGGHDPDYDPMYIRASAILAVIDWALERGSPALDIAGGNKNLWGPVGGQRYGAIFRPPSIDLLARIIDN